MTDLFDRLKAALADRYAVEHELGSGAMATVYLAHDLRHDRKVAVKVLRPELAAALGPERFLAEIKVTANLRHPHILPLFDSGEAESFLYYVMPYIRGETLRQRLNREQQIPVEEALQIACEVADALGSAHSQGVVHRDIKPENILLEGGHAVVADFGIARAVSVAGGERLTETGMAIGTPAYMSPEQGSGERQLDGRSDLYSLACMLYEMLAGEPPYTGPTGQAVIAKRMSEPVPHVSTLRDTVPAATEQVITKALARTPADRFATAAQFVEALKGSAAAPPAPPPIVWIQRSLLVVVPLVVLGVWWTTRDRPSTEEWRSVAVLTCENSSGDSAEEYLSDRWTEELIFKLSITQLRVKTWDFVRQYKRSTLRDEEIAAELAAGTLVRCAVEHTGDSVHFRAQLIDPHNGEILLSLDDRDARTVEGIDRMQTTAARQMADALGAEISPANVERLARVPTQDPEAFNRYRLGRRFWDIRTPDALQTSIGYYEEAIARDSGFALAYAALAEAKVFYGQIASLRPDAYWPEVRQAAERALEIDSTTAEAHSWMGKYWAMYEWDWARADSAHRQALRLAPNSPRVLLWYGQDLTILGRHDQAITYLQRAVELEPAYGFYRDNLAWRYYYARRFEEARDELERSLQLDSLDFVAHWTLGVVALAMGQTGEAIERLEEAFRLCDECVTPLPHLAEAYARADRRVEVEGVLRELESRADTGYVSAVHFAMVYLALGNRNEASGWFDRAREERSLELVWTLADDRLHDDLRSEEWYQRLRRGVGFDER